MTGAHFPCYKMVDEQNQKVVLRPMTTFTMLRNYFLYLFTVVLIGGLSIVAIKISGNGLSYTDVTDAFDKHGGSKLDYGTFSLVVIDSLIVHIVVVMKNISYKQQLAEIQNLFEKYSAIDVQILKSSKKWIVPMAVTGFVMLWSGYLVFINGLVLLMVEEYDMTFEHQLPFILLQTGLGHLLHYPIYAFSHTYIEICQNFSAWAQTILANPNQLLLDTYHLMDTIAYASKAMAVQLFSIVLMCVLILIGLSFSLVSYFLVNRWFTARSCVLMISGIGLVALWCIIYLLFIVCLSQNIVDQVQELSYAIRSYSSDESHVWLDGKKFEWRDFREIVLYSVDNFQGFDGWGYFKINKALLATIAGHFMTYFIVLVDFKIND